MERSEGKGVLSVLEFATRSSAVAGLLLYVGIKGSGSLA